ncbi:MAG: translation initiation factor IF-5A [Candidatus Woesearchaeota archaeon]|nr:translation initiation factor IF-5A [Candidatus Woesearchaeota archaeon]
MSDIKLTHATSLKKGSYLLVDGNPCIVKSEPQVSRPGKHGHAKVRIKAMDIITGSTKEVVKPGHDSIEVPLILKKKGQVLSVDGTNAEVMDMETFEQFTADLKIADEELDGKIEAGQTVVFWQVMGRYIIKSISEDA